MIDIYIVIKEYDEEMAKRQPWYSIKKLVCDLTRLDKHVSIVNHISAVPGGFLGIVIKTFGLSDLWTVNGKSNYRLIYFMTFPAYGFGKFLSFSKNTLRQNWKDLKRIFIFSLMPKSILVKTLGRAEFVVTISDRSDDFLSKYG